VRLSQNNVYGQLSKKFLNHWGLLLYFLFIGALNKSVIILRYRWSRR